MNNALILISQKAAPVPWKPLCCQKYVNIVDDIDSLEA